MPKLPTTWQEVLDMPHKHKGIKGVPSCSGLDRKLTCNASHFLDQDVEREENDNMRLGTAIHYCLERNWKPDDMPPEEEWVYDRSLAILDWVVGETGFNCKYQVEPYYEKPWLTGSIDLVHIGNADKKKILVIDWKTGRTEVSEDTKQLGGYASLVFDKHPETTDVYGCIIQPLVTGRPEICHWSREKAYELIEKPLKAGLDPNQFAVSAKGCQWCPHSLTSKCNPTKDIFGAFLCN